MRNTPQLIFITLAGALLPGCSALENLVGYTPKAAVTQINLIAKAAANQNNATTVDLVFVFSPSVLEILPKTTPEWFEKKSGIIAGSPAALAVVSFGVPPSTISNAVALPAGHSDAIAVYGYTNYLATGGQTRGDISLLSCAQITLEPQTVAYASCADASTSTSAGSEKGSP